MSTKHFFWLVGCVLGTYILVCKQARILSSLFLLLFSCFIAMDATRRWTTHPLRWQHEVISSRSHLGLKHTKPARAVQCKCSNGSVTMAGSLTDFSQSVAVYALNIITDYRILLSIRYCIINSQNLFQCKP